MSLSCIQIRAASTARMCASRAAGLRWPADEQFRAGKDCLGLDESQVRLYTAIARYTVLVMTALAICAVTAAQLQDWQDTVSLPLAPASRCVDVRRLRRP